MENKTVTINDVTYVVNPTQWVLEIDTQDIADDDSLNDVCAGVINATTCEEYVYDTSKPVPYFTYDYIAQRYPRVRQVIDRAPNAELLKTCYFTAGYECLCACDPVTDEEVH